MAERTSNGPEPSADKNDESSGDTELSSDPTRTSHPTGEEQAAENEENELPA